MPVPSPRNPICPARGLLADLQANVAELKEGELVWATDEDAQYTKEGGVLVRSAFDQSTAPVTSVAGKLGDVTLSKADITDLDEADYATAAQGALADSALQSGDVGTTVQPYDANTVVDASYVHTDNNYTTAEKTKLSGIEAGAEVNVNADWDAASGDAQILNKPTLGTAAAAEVADFATAAQGGLADSAIQPGDNVSSLANDAGFIDAAQAAAAAPVQSVAGRVGAVTLSKGDVGLSDVDNTSDLAKPISTATQAALGLKADLVGGKLPTSQIPAVAITEYLGVAASEAEMLLLTGQPGDWCLRSDVSVAYVVIAADTTMATSWQAVTLPGSAVTSIQGQTGIVNLSAADVGAATAAQGALADSAVQPGDNVSALTNDAGYITSAQAPGTSLSYTASTRVIASSTGGSATLTEVVASGNSGLMTGSDKAKLDGIAAGAQVNSVYSVAGKAGHVSLSAADVGAATSFQGTLANSALQPGSRIPAAAGSQSSPGVYFDSDTGFFSPGSNVVAISTGGVSRLVFMGSGDIVMPGTSAGAGLWFGTGDAGGNNASANYRIGQNSSGIGSATLYIGNAAIQVSSDARLKENIQDTTLGAVEKLQQVRVVDFTWNDPSDTSYNNRNARGTWTGVIAQELVDVFPFAVNAPRKEEDLSIDYESGSTWTVEPQQLVPVLIKAIQEQQAVITDLQNRLALLEAG